MTGWRRWLVVLAAVWALEAGLRILALPGLRPSFDLVEMVWGQVPAAVEQPSGLEVLLHVAVESFLTAVALVGVWWGGSTVLRAVKDLRAPGGDAPAGSSRVGGTDPA